MTAENEGHDAHCEAEYVTGAAAYTDCGCADRAKRVPEAEVEAAALVILRRVTHSPAAELGSSAVNPNGDYYRGQARAALVAAQHVRDARSPLAFIERRATQIESLGAAFADDAETLRRAVSILEQFGPAVEEEARA